MSDTHDISVEREAVFSPDDPPAEAPAEVTESLDAKPEDEPPEDAAKPDQPDDTESPKTKIQKLAGRVGRAMRLLNERDAQLAQKTAELEALRQLLPADAKPETPPPADVETRAAQIADQRLFDAECNKLFQAGVGEFGDEFQQSLVNLQSMSLVNRPLVEAAMETGAPAAILKHLGEDLDEAERINALPAARMGAALAKLATRLTTKEHSNAPPPIRPVNGSGATDPDIYNPNLSDAEYRKIRAKQGAWWAQDENPGF